MTLFTISWVLNIALSVPLIRSQQLWRSIITIAVSLEKEQTCDVLYLRFFSKSHLFDFSDVTLGVHCGLCVNIHASAFYVA